MFLVTIILYAALNDLHSKINSIAFKKICKYIDNTYSKDPNDRFSIGTKYECDPGDNVKRNFYILKVSSEKIDLIMEQNIIDSTMTWYVAMEYFRSGDGKTTKDSWTDVQDLDLPKIQDIIDAVGRTSWNAAENNSYWCMESQRQDSSSNPYCYNNDGNLETLWLWDYFADCGGWNCEHNLGSGHANGYWARDAVANTSWAWGVSYFSLIDRDVATYSTKYGIRPTITVFKTNLYG